MLRALTSRVSSSILRSSLSSSSLSLSNRSLRSVKTPFVRTFGAAPAEPKEYVSLSFFHMPSGERVLVKDAVVGETLLQAAERAGVPLEADCKGGGYPGETWEKGGEPSCAYCHVYMPLEVVGEASFMEDKLTRQCFELQENSRLACQVEITKEMDGITVAVPAQRYMQQTDTLVH